MTGPSYSLSRKEGWRRYVDAPARQRPEPLTAGQLAALGGQAREEYDEARHDWHANFGILRTPQLAAASRARPGLLPGALMTRSWIATCRWGRCGGAGPGTARRAWPS